jgi:AraC family transcriptional regulator of adaptative response/methylated-DNA-[protein]-cysteine methyltransferase
VYLETVHEEADMPINQQHANASLITEQDPRWQAVVHKDANYKPQFVYAVKTTGTYAYPDSPSKIPDIDNIIFFESAEQAEAAGFRANQRAAQNKRQLSQYYVELVGKACVLIDQAEVSPSLQQLAEGVGLSAYHFHRIFKQQTGLTPKAYSQAKRAEKIRQQLQHQSPEKQRLRQQSSHKQGTKLSITHAIYQAGFNSNSQFYEQSTNVLGMTASNYKQGGKHSVIRFALGQCQLGHILVAQSDIGICAIALDDNPEQLIIQLQDQFPHAHLIGSDSDFEQLVAQVVGFVQAPEIGLNLPLDIQGTAFQQRVWQALQKIPVGKTVTYSDIAQLLGVPKAFRAVANACAANKIAVAIPCHRVVRQDGNLSGYRWGVARKRQLLAHEESVQRINNAIL